MKKTLLTVLISSAFLLTACGGGDDGDENASGSGNGAGDNGGVIVQPESPIPPNNIADPVVRTEVYTATNMTSVAGESVVMTYKMLGVNGQEVQATSLVITPKAAAPAKGWPIVVWAHGTTGVADQCAPSRSKLKVEIEGMIAQLLSAGYVVVAPDYEGLGEPTGKEFHPFLNLKSEAYSITDAVVAARNYLGVKVSNQWMAVGHSQGGHAALGAAQYASRANLDYKGAVVVAPASNLKTIFNTAQQLVANLPAKDQVSTLASLNTYAALITAGMQGQSAPPTYAQVFETNAATIAAQAETICSEPLGLDFGTKMGTAAATTNSLSGYLTQSNFMQIPAISTFLNTTSQPLSVKVTTPVKIYQGGSDPTVPANATTELITNATKLGTQIDLKYDPAWNHTTAYTSNIPNIVTDVKSLMPIQ
ncbi:triacylglycerol lipase [Acinetobacter sp. ANC 4169]|uniref:alpha/beta hydrolase n=1 Tax=Acinetobacter sp. ANC 4169 TaxID=1977879 RepID=UPI000A3501B5|nr:alpha/beta fold hydrolase [Acinetobacter sp. ANC 4169]OTG71580.1 triacylglycerol lipase [Acinetobacter sp. ANC 4169]